VLVAVAVFLGAADVRSGESPAGDGAGVYADMVRVGPGSYRSLFTDAPDDMRVEVDAFYLDRFPVTNGEFAEFVVQHPEWARGTIKTVFADASYLAQLDSEPLASIRDQPVTNVSWFAATAYCESRGKRLPTVDEWELAGQASRDAADGTQDRRIDSRYSNGMASRRSCVCPTSAIPKRTTGEYTACTASSGNSSTISTARS
jgi:formylglycine-generating enzyme required for sulfatase activity